MVKDPWGIKSEPFWYPGVKVTFLLIFGSS